MYRSFYGLKNEPFALKPDGDCLYLSDIHREAIANLLYGVSAEKGFLMLTGEVGTGKTTLLNALLSKLDDTVYVCLINNPKLEVKDFYHYAASLLGFQFGNTKGEFIMFFKLSTYSRPAQIFWEDVVVVEFTVECCLADLQLFGSNVDDAVYLSELCQQYFLLDFG